MDKWISAKDGLPEFNARVVAWMEGTSNLPESAWGRSGYALMVRHKDHSDKDGWSHSHLSAACRDLGADRLEVTHWAPLRPPEQALTMWWELE